MRNNEGRVVVWFSCGAASAVAAKLAVDSHEYVEVVYCNTLKTEHPDNTRFMRDVEKWINHPVTIISSEKYEDVDDVFMKVKYMAGVRGAPCTREMKKKPRLEFQRPNDLHIFGLTSDETRRITRFEEQNADLDMEWNLRDAGITKEDCYQIIKDADIPLPEMYALGFKNNNCIGCVKSTSPAYWCRVKKHFPDVFKRRVEQSRKLGVRLIQYKGTRIFLDELPCHLVDPQGHEEDIECGVICVSESESKLVQIGQA